MHKSNYNINSWNLFYSLLRDVKFELFDKIDKKYRNSKLLCYDLTTLHANSWSNEKIKYYKTHLILTLLLGVTACINFTTCPQ